MKETNVEVQCVNCGHVGDALLADLKFDGAFFTIKERCDECWGHKVLIYED